MGELTSTTSSDFIATLARATAPERQGRGDRPAPQAVVSALLQAEKAAKQQKLTYPLKSLLGEWRLWFVAPRKAHIKQGIEVGKGFYVPRLVAAQISFTPGAVTSNPNAAQFGIGNQLQLGPLRVKLTGPAQPLGKKNLLAFDFTHIRIMLLGRRVYSSEFGGRKAIATDCSGQGIAKLPFFVFFCVGESFIAARGRGGGLALWVKER